MTGLAWLEDIHFSFSLCLDITLTTTTITYWEINLCAISIKYLAQKGPALCVLMSDCFRVSVNLSLAVYLLQSLSVILYHSVSVSIFHAICPSHPFSVCLSHSEYLFQHISVCLFLSLCSCQFVTSALSLSVCSKCPVPPVCLCLPISIADCCCLEYYGLFSVFLLLSMKKKLPHGYSGFRQ